MNLNRQKIKLDQIKLIFYFFDKKKATCLLSIPKWLVLTAKSKQHHLAGHHIWQSFLAMHGFFPHRKDSNTMAQQSMPKHGAHTRIRFDSTAYPAMALAKHGPSHSNTNFLKIPIRSGR